MMSLPALNSIQTLEPADPQTLNLQTLNLQTLIHSSITPPLLSLRSGPILRRLALETLNHRRPCITSQIV